MLITLNLIHFHRPLTRTSISEEAPNWFKITNKESIKKYDEYIKNNEDTISVFSKFQKWITVTPKKKDRRHPLESLKNVRFLFLLIGWYG